MKLGFAIMVTVVSWDLTDQSLLQVYTLQVTAGSFLLSSKYYLFLVESVAFIELPTETGVWSAVYVLGAHTLPFSLPVVLIDFRLGCD